MTTVKLLLGKIEEAAYWIVVAMGTCHDNGLNDIGQGLCRLLLPKGNVLVVTGAHSGFVGYVSVIIILCGYENKKRFAVFILKLIKKFFFGGCHY